MKCPKCGYLGFEEIDACRNCGYDFSLARRGAEAELPLRLDSRYEALDDLALPLSESAADLDRLIGLPPPAVQPAPAPESAADDTELPLFLSTAPDDEPLIKTASTPRIPLSVRRTTPEAARLTRDHPRVQSLTFDMDDSAGAQPTTVTPAPGRQALRPGSDHAGGATDPEWATDQPAGVGPRLGAVVIDLALLAIIDALVIYFTVQICGLTLQDFGVLPKGPLIAFMLVQNGGYLVAFTAGGQTIGKMATGIRVVPSGPERGLDLGHALRREFMWLVLAIPAGLGFLSTFSNPDRRGFHDRFAGTRVIVN